MAGLIIEQNTDGTATINFPDGGQQTAGGDNPVKALQNAYGSRIGSVVSSSKSSADQAAASLAIRRNYKTAAIENTLNGIANVADTTGQGYSEQDVQRWINGGNGAVLGITSVEQYVSQKENRGRQILSTYFDNETLSGMSRKQLLAATELFHQGTRDTGRSNGLSVQDLDFIVNKANSFSGATWSPNGTAISLGDDPVIIPTISSPGVTEDTRNWKSIVASENPVVAAQVATAQMYGGTYVDYTTGYQRNRNGNYLRDEDGKVIPEEQPSLYLRGNNGAYITKLDPSLSFDYMSATLQNFGVKDTSWISNVSSLMDSALLGQYKTAFDSLQSSYNPFGEYTSLFKTSFVRNVSTPFDIGEVSATTTTPETQTGTGTTPTTETQTNDDQSATPTPPQGTPPVGDQTYPTYTVPENAGYTLPADYSGSGTSTQVQTPSMPDSIKEGINLYGTLPFQYTPTTTYTIGQGGVTGGTGAQQTQNYTVRQFRNATGLTTSITFLNGRPMTTIPSGFYPIEQQPTGTSGVDAQTASAFSTTQPSQVAPQVAPPPTPASSQIAAPQVQAAPTAASANMGTSTGYTPQFMATGGSVQQHMAPASTQPVGEFAGFRPEALQRIANTMGYQGDMNGFNTYLQQNPVANERMNYFTNAARRMAKGGVLRASNGVDTTGAVASGNATRVMPTALAQQYIPQQQFPAGANLPTVQAEIAKTPGLPTGATIVPVGSTLEADQLVSPYSGQVSGSVALPTAQADTTAAAMPQAQQAMQASVVESTPAISDALETLQAAQGSIDPRAEILAAQQTASSVGNVQAAQGNAILMDNPVQRQIQDGELISGAANAQTAAAFTEQVEAATATPTKQATVQGQLEGLMAQFEGGNTPAWAAGSMRNAMATLAARGLGASSLAGQAVIQAAMESALPIAQIDAQTMASFEVQNLSNRQQRAMLAAQQRAQFIGQEFDQAFQSRVANAAKVSDVANMNFTAEQQVALENSRIANTMNLQNLNNRQAMVMAEAAALANLDMQNLNNRQQSAVQNAQNFLSMDMANLSNQQQTDLFKAQQRVQSLFTDQAAQNAAQQFNASSQNQVDQFFASLATQTAQFNATQANAQSQFNAGQVNTIERFNAEINNQRDQFNAQNRLIIDQSNAQWRREIATADTAAVNRANELNATALIGLSQSAYNNLWQYYRDNMEWAWTSAENERQRITNIGIAQLQANASKDIQNMKNDYESSANFGSAVFKFLTTDISDSILGGLFG